MNVNEVTNIAPFINTIFTITSAWWTERTLNGVIAIHRGLDITTGANDVVYSILSGVIHSKGYDNSMGNWVIIHDRTTGIASLYMHLRDPVSLPIGKLVAKNEPIGYEGATGEGVTGIHLHVEMQNISRFNNQWHWSYNKSDYIDPTEYMGIENVEGTRWIYNATPIDPTYKKDANFKWVLYAKKLRNKAYFG